MLFERLCFVQKDISVMPIRAVNQPYVVWISTSRLSPFKSNITKTTLPYQNSFQTNGYLLDKEWCKFFHENHFLVGLSIDGTREIHNIYRRTANNEDTFDRVVASAKLMDQYQVDYNI